MSSSAEENKPVVEKYIKGKECPKRHQKKVLDKGSVWINGNPSTPASDTEMESYYVCANPKCKNEWTEYS